MVEGQEVLAEVAGRQISAAQVIGRLKLKGLWRATVDELASEAVVAQAAQQEGLAVADEELQEAFDQFRREAGLHQAEQTRQWLESTGLELEEVESWVEAGLLAAKLAQKLVPDADVDRYYAEHPKEFEYARVSHLVVEDAGAAQELALTLKEEGEEFSKLARQHSIDDSTRCGGGFLGLLTRSDAGGLPDEVADRIFAAAAGELIGPFPLGDNHCLIRVEEVGRRPLDDQLRNELRQSLFAQWLADKVGAAA